MTDMWDCDGVRSGRVKVIIDGVQYIPPGASGRTAPPPAPPVDWDTLEIGVEYVVAGGERAFTSTLSAKISDMELKVCELWFANGRNVTDRSIGITRLHPLGG